MARQTCQSVSGQSQSVRIAVPQQPPAPSSVRLRAHHCCFLSESAEALASLFAHLDAAFLSWLTWARRQGLSARCMPSRSTTDTSVQATVRACGGGRGTRAHLCLQALERPFEFLLLLLGRRAPVVGQRLFVLCILPLDVLFADAQVEDCAAGVTARSGTSHLCAPVRATQRRRNRRATGGASQYLMHAATQHTVLSIVHTLSADATCPSGSIGPTPIAPRRRLRRVCVYHSPRGQQAVPVMRRHSNHTRQGVTRSEPWP